MTEQTKNYFEILNEINVSDKIEKKNGLSYLSWAWAWGELKKRHPSAKKSVVKNEQGCLYHTDGKTCWVEVSVSIGEIEETEYLPVMDYKNQPVPLERITSTAVNTALQRAVTKAIARHGLGLYIYAGEDLPENAEEEPKKKNPLIGLAKAADEDMADTLRQKNEDQFDVVKLAIMGLGSVPELEAAWKAKSKEINALEKYAPSLYEELKAIAKREKQKLTEE